MARRAKEPERKGAGSARALKTFFHFTQRRDFHSLRSRNGREMCVYVGTARIARISDSRISVLGLHDRKLSGLYQSFTRVFDIRLALMAGARGTGTRDVCQRRESPFWKPFLRLSVDIPARFV